MILDFESIVLLPEMAAVLSLIMEDENPHLWLLEGKRLYLGGKKGLFHVNGKTHVYPTSKLEMFCVNINLLLGKYVLKILAQYISKFWNYG